MGWVGFPGARRTGEADGVAGWGCSRMGWEFAKTPWWRQACALKWLQQDARAWARVQRS